MALKPLRPCRHPGCAALTREGTVPSTSPRKPLAGSRRNITAGTACLSGRTTCARRSSCGSRSAASAPRSIRPETPGTAPGQRWWTTSSPTGGAGRCSSTRPTTRACANDAMTRKRHGSRQKNDGNETEFEASVGLEATSAPGCAGGHRGACAGESLWLSRPTPTPRKFCGWGRKTAGPLVCEKMSPIRDLGGWR